MTDRALSGYSALYARLDAMDEAVAGARARRAKNPELLDAVVAPADPDGFIAALDALIPKVQAAFNAAQAAQQFDKADAIEAALSRLYFWRIYARDQLIAALDNASDAAMAALQTAAATLRQTAQDFDQGDDDTATALTSLDDFAKAVGLKQ